MMIASCFDDNMMIASCCDDNPEGERRMFHRNVDIQMPDYTASKSAIPRSSANM
jgi:hypothetical protein